MDKDSTNASVPPRGVLTNGKPGGGEGGEGRGINSPIYISGVAGGMRGKG